PQTANWQVKGLNIAAPTNINLLAQAGTVTYVNASPFRVYNWHTNAWDIISLDQNTFTTNNIGAYMSATGRVLLQFSTMAGQVGSLDFGRPIINLQGVISDQSYGSS